MAFDLLRQTIEGTSHDRLDDLGILSLGQHRRADEVSEERGRELALLAPPYLLREGGTAFAAELGVVGVLRITGGHRSIRERYTLAS